MSYSEGGPSNGQISRRPIDTGLSPSGIVFLHRRAILCSYMVLPYAGQSQRDGKVENSLNFKIFLTLCKYRTDRARSSISFLGTLHTRTHPPCKWEGTGMHSFATTACQMWGEIQVKSGNYRAKCPILKGVHQPARSPDDLQIQG